MRNYSIAFVGLGSIGKRHIRNVATFLRSRGDDFVIDLYRHNPTQNDIDADIRGLVSSVYDANKKIQSELEYDIVFITNPTSLHELTVEKFLPHTKSFFIEKPVFCRTDVLESLLRDLSSTITYVACPLRYKPLLQYVKNNLDLKSVFSVRAICSSYLPDWRPGQDYRKCYSAHKEMGGGVSIDLIHEWDYLTWLFGMPSECLQLINKVSDLEIDSDDLAIYIGRNEKTTFELHLDYFGRKNMRNMEIFLPEDTIVCDILGGNLHYLRDDKIIHFDANVQTSYMNEIEHFFKIVDGIEKSDNTALNALEVLKLTLGEQKKQL